uniref:hypothetical protein n=1 Tax=Salmonella enterica TaxID=28901 RepID=UPI003A91DDC6
MKLSPEAKQAVKTAIEQLRLLLVDEDDVESLERLKKTFLHGAKTIIDELDEKLKAQVAMLQAEKRPHYEAQEVEKVISDIMRIAASSELLRQLQAEKRPDNEALVSITTNCYVSGKVKVKQA